MHAGKIAQTLYAAMSLIYNREREMDGKRSAQEGSHKVGRAIYAATGLIKQETEGMGEPTVLCLKRLHTKRPVEEASRWRGWQSGAKEVVQCAVWCR